MVRYGIFRLGMPNCASWNGQWSGSGKRYVVARQITDKELAAMQGRTYFYYNFGDGWGASVSVELVEGAKSKNNAIKDSDGFCGYDWMVDSILEYGVIKTNG